MSNMLILCAKINEFERKGLKNEVHLEMKMVSILKVCTLNHNISPSGQYYQLQVQLDSRVHDLGLFSTVPNAWSRPYQNCSYNSGTEKEKEKS